MKKKLIVIGFIIILLIVITYNNKSTNKKEVDLTKNLIAIQSKKESDFKTEGFTVDNPNIILNPYGNSPLSALIIFETTNKISPKVTIKGKDKHSTYTHTFDSNKKHYLPIYGLYPDKTNIIIVEYLDNDQKIKKEFKIETEKLPDDFILPTNIKANKDKLSNELYFFSPSSKGYTCAYDVNGDVRWYLTNNALWKIDRLKNGHLLVSTERRINAPYYMTGLYEIDLLGKIYNEYSLEGGYHHDYYEMENGNLLIASDDFSGGTVEDIIVELERDTGNIIKTFDLKDILKQTDGKSDNWTEYDWFHNNSVWYDKKTNSITLSGRHQDAVINIDYETGKLNWIIGDSTNWSKEYQKYFFKPIGELEWQWSQHAAMITPEGYVFILDNGNNKSKIKEEFIPATKSYTRGVMYEIDTKNMTIKQIWQYGKERGSKFYSPYISDVDYLDKSHYIVHSGGIVYKDGKIQNAPAGLSGADKLVSTTVEILNDEVIFEINLPTNNYRVEKMSLYEDDKQLEFSKAKRIGSLGQTKIDSKKFGFMSNSIKIDDEYKSHNITLTKEIDRLVVSGQFKKDQDINVILYKNMNQKLYNIRVSKKPYTALCLDIFTEEENEFGITVTKYINSEKLKGKYSIYIQIDDKIYNTKKSVTFNKN